MDPAAELVRLHSPKQKAKLCFSLLNRYTQVEKLAVVGCLFTSEAAAVFRRGRCRAGIIEPPRQ